MEFVKDIEVCCNCSITWAKSKQWKMWQVFERDEQMACIGMNGFLQAYSRKIPNGRLSTLALP
jgi:hypothetical protein